jgi:hypothetical protein
MTRRKQQRPANTQRDQERKALLSYALYRWENAALLGLTLILVVFVPDPFRGALPFWGWWIWLVLGGAAVALIVATTLDSPDVRARVAGDLLRDRLNPAAIHHLDYGQKLEAALQRRHQAEVLLQRTRDRTQRDRLQTVADDASRWTESVYKLSKGLDDYQGDLYLQQRRTALPSEIAELEAQLTRVSDAGIKSRLEREIRERRARQQTLRDLDQAAVQAESRIDDSLRAWETIYAQLQLVAAQGMDERRLRQVRAALEAQIEGLDKARAAVRDLLEQVRA